MPSLLAAKDVGLASTYAPSWLIPEQSRIDELKLLKDGWLDGQGIAPSHDGLDWLSKALDRYYPRDLSQPYLFPTPEGHVLAEWSLPPWSPSLEIDLAKKRGAWHALNLDTDIESTKELDLTRADDWKWLDQEIRKLRSGEK